MCLIFTYLFTKLHNRWKMTLKVTQVNLTKFMRQRLHLTTKMKRLVERISPLKYFQVTQLKRKEEKQQGAFLTRQYAKR